MFQRIGPAAFKKDLTNILKLCELLDNPQQKFKAIHIAGTNGKGSVSHILAAVLQAAGYKVGLYTSPHYKDFRERIKIDGQLIGEQAVIDFVERYKQHFETIKPSFFEITVAMAFDHFAKNGVEIGVIETGLGGRLDSTNILSPLVAVITNVGYDHMEFLGNTLPDIAAEKAGIIKANTPVVIGETNYETAPVFLQFAENQKADIKFADQHFRVSLLDKSLKGMVLDVYRHEQPYLEQLQSDLNGGFQLKNIPTALCSINQLSSVGIKIENAAIRSGLGDVKRLTNFIGRWQVVSTQPMTIFDSGHNLEGMQEVVAELKQLSYKQLHFVMGAVKDKDPGTILSILPKEASYYFCKPDIPRGMDGKVLKEKANQYGLHGESFASVIEAFNTAKEQAKNDDLVFVGGSAFVVAEVL